MAPASARKGRERGDFDRGPTAQLAGHFGGVADAPVKGDFWFDWGPVFYRGRLDGSARVLCVASDPGPTERVDEEHIAWA